LGTTKTLDRKLTRENIGNQKDTDVSKKTLKKESLANNQTNPPEDENTI